MKKKFLTLLLACAMTFPFVLTSCGRLSDEIVEEDDDDDEDEEEDDKPVYVDVLSTSDLKGQVKVLVKNLDEWVGDDSSSAPVDRFEYMVTDLDHNGRIEILVNTVFEYGNNELHLYEVDEEEKGLEEAKWKFKGLEISSDKYPDPEAFISSVYDKKKNTTCYQFTNYFDNGNDEFGISYMDVTFADGKVQCNTYAGSVMGTDWEFYTEDDSDIDNLDEFGEYTMEYHDSKDLDWVNLGIYKESAYSNSGLSDASEDDLKDLLTDSYMVFAGKMNYEEFEEEHASASSAEDYEEYYESLIGKWNLYSIDSYYGTDYYDEDSSDFLTCSFFEDYTMRFTIYMDYEIIYDEVLSVECIDGDPLINIYDSDGELFDDYLDHVQFVFGDMSQDGQELYVTSFGYDKDGECEEGDSCVLIRDKGDDPENVYSIDRYVGDWNIVSSELEGDVTYYEEGGDFFVTLTVYANGNISMKESSYGSVFLEISECLERYEDGQWYFEYSDPDSLNTAVASETYTFAAIGEDDQELEVSIDFYDSNGEWLGYTILLFERA